MTTTPKTITDDQIRKLRDEAAEAGDYVQVAICRRALGKPVVTSGGRILDGMLKPEARAECARVIAEVEAMEDDEDAEVWTRCAYCGADVVEHDAPATADDDGSDPEG